METQSDPRIAYLVAAHTDFEQLIRLCIQLVLSGDVYIHIDKKVNQDKYQSLLKKFEQHNLNTNNRIYFIKDRISVYWAGFSQVKLQRIFLKTTLEATEKNYSRFVFLSGLCYPIKSAQYIIDEFKKNRTKEYVCAINLTEYKSKAQKIRYSGYHFFRDTNIRPILLKRFLVSSSVKLLWCLNIRKPYHIKHNGQNEDIFFGGSWMGLTRECAEYVYQNLGKTSRYYRYFKYTYACDELCIPTIVFNSIFKTKACLVKDYNYPKPGALFSALSPLHHLLYQGLIKIYTEDDFQDLIKTDRLFVRKVMSGKSDRLIKQLDASFATLEP